jgi:CheY-like chemotaxis protein
LRVIGEASDGLEAVQKAERLRPDLILLDLGLPTLNGIEAAQRIRMLSPESKLLFVSQDYSADVVQEALAAGACGYVIKTDARSELLTAIDVVLRGEQFLGRRFSSHDFTRATNFAPRQGVRSVFAPLEQNMQIISRHEAGFYSDDRCFLDDITQFIGAALKAGNAAIVAATESHRDSLLLRLQELDLDIDDAVEQGRYIALDAADTLLTFMLRGMPDPVRFLKLLGELTST